MGIVVGNKGPLAGIAGLLGHIDIAQQEVRGPALEDVLAVVLFVPGPAPA